MRKLVWPQGREPCPDVFSFCPLNLASKAEGFSRWINNDVRMFVVVGEDIACLFQSGEKAKSVDASVPCFCDYALPRRAVGQMRYCTSCGLIHLPASETLRSVGLEKNCATTVRNKPGIGNGTL